MASRTEHDRARPRAGRLSPRAQRGLTLIELVLVVFIVGILFSITVAQVFSLSPVYRVRSASRVLAAKIEEVRSLAIATGKLLGIRYSLYDDGSYYQLIPPPPQDYPDEPVENRALGVRNDLPPGVRFRQVTFNTGRTVKSPGAVNILFSPLGNTGTHAVTLEGQTREGRPIVISLKFNAITGTLDFVGGDAEFADHED